MKLIVISPMLILMNFPEGFTLVEVSSHSL